MKKENLNIPNLLSFYRLVSFPFVMFFAISGMEKTFVVLLVINLISDVLDGLIARVTKQQTEFGARLDSVADFGVYISAFTGIFVFKYADIEPHLTSLFIFIGLFLAAYFFSLIKFKRFPSLHLYSWKIGGYIQGSFFFLIFVFDFYPVYYYFMITWGVLAFLEHIVIQMILPEMRSDQKGLYWVLKNQHD